MQWGGGIGIAIRLQRPDAALADHELATSWTGSRFGTPKRVAHCFIWLRTAALGGDHGQRSAEFRTKCIGHMRRLGRSQVMSLAQQGSTG